MEEIGESAQYLSTVLFNTGDKKKHVLFLRGFINKLYLEKSWWNKTNYESVG